MEDQVLISRDKLEKLEKEAGVPREQIRFHSYQSMRGLEWDEMQYFGHDETVRLITDKYNHAEKQKEELESQLNILDNSFYARLVYLFSGNIHEATK